MLAYAFVGLVVMAAYVRGQEDVVVSNNTAECADQMIKWCAGMKFPEQGASMTMLANSYKTPDGFSRVLCISDSEGTNCTKNGQPWFSCTPDNTFYYKGQVLTSDSKDGADDEMCATADQAFNDLFVQNLDVRNITTDIQTELQKGFRSFFEEMMRMQEQIDQLNNWLSGGDLWDMGRRGGRGPYRTYSPTETEREN